MNVVTRGKATPDSFSLRQLMALIYGTARPRDTRPQGARTLEIH